jgi:prolipoprotein diacylglyceryltransferase
LFALYVAGYSAFRIFEESVRIDSSAHFLGLRLNFFIACLGTAAGLAWFAFAQRRRRETGPPQRAGSGAGEVQAGDAKSVGGRRLTPGPGVQDGSSTG